MGLWLSCVSVFMVVVYSGDCSAMSGGLYHTGDFSSSFLPLNVFSCQRSFRLLPKPMVSGSDHCGFGQPALQGAASSRRLRSKKGRSGFKISTCRETDGKVRKEKYVLLDLGR